MAYANTFKRHEMKFLLTAEKYAALIKAISPYMTEDEYGRTTICNIYCDNDNHDVIRTSLDKPAYKEKLRLRTYGAASDDGVSFLEIKKKFKGIVYKRRVQLPYKQALEYITEGKKPAVMNQQLEEIEYLRTRLSLKPSIVICYDRRAFFGNEDKEFRITLDSNIRSRTTDLDLRRGAYGELLEGQPFCVLEIKTALAMPLWMTRILSELKLYQTAFSKYGSIYKASMTKNNNNRGTEECSQVS